MISIRQSEDRGHTSLGWLDSRHSFSFGAYYDPEHMGFRSLRVLNDDRVEAGSGFGEHPHRDMEILSLVVDGALSHKDSTGNQSIIREGTLQKMSAGSGITHSEFNASRSAPVHFLQIWIEPRQRGLSPSYEEIELPVAGTAPLHLIASPTGKVDTVRLAQDAFVYRASLNPGQSLSLPLADGRYGWLQVIRGEVQLNGHSLHAGDGARIENVTSPSVQSAESSEFLFFDLA